MSQAALRARVKTMSEGLLRGLLKSILECGEQAAVQVAPGCSSATRSMSSHCWPCALFRQMLQTKKARTAKKTTEPWRSSGFLAGC